MTVLERVRDSAARWIAPRRATAKANPIESPVMLSTASSAASALQCGAVWSCCRLIAEALSALPGHIYMHTDAGRERAPKHPYYRMLTLQPNPLMTMPLWLETVVLHLMLYGNAYILPEFVDGEVFALWPIPPDRAHIQILASGIYTYRVLTANGQSLTLDPTQIIHIRLFSLDGIVGLSPIEYQQMAFQIDGLTRVYSAALYGNNGRPSGVLEVPGNLGKDQVADLRANWKIIHGSGLQSVGNIAVLEGGTTYKPIAVPPEQLEFIQQQRFSVEQIARIFGVPPHLIGANDKPTYASVEQQSLEFVQYRLQPIVTNIERSIQSALLQVPYFYKLNLAAFERSDIKTRYAAYAVARQWGWMSVNDIRSLEDLNSIGPEGDVYLQPLNMVPASVTEPETIPTGGVQ